ncbi:MAG: hypothetical protein IJ019_02515 [Alphaproteobacteria bacterium]|nr:hypothetical protein [Alphaproteobacteria bacterium]
MRKICESGCFILSKSSADEQIFLSDMYKKRTQAKKHRLDAAQFGRSMVEMLGVLAIIGVLSIGGIAGYSKAMFKHKMNQTIDIVSRVLMNIAELPSNTVLGMDEAIKIGILDGLSCNTDSCQLPIQGCTMYVSSSLISIKLDGSKSDNIKFCTDFLAYHWENMLPDYVRHVSPLNYSGTFHPVYNNADLHLGGDDFSTKLTYNLNDIQDACKKSCDNDLFCYVYINLN